MAVATAAGVAVEVGADRAALELVAQEQFMNAEYVEELWNRRQALVLRVVSNRLYQQSRQSIFEWREGVVKVASLIAGSVVFAKVADPVLVTWSVAVIFGGTAASLVFGWGSKARDAARRTAEWTQLESEVEAVGLRAYTEQQLNEWTSRINKIESGEPAQSKGLWARSYSKACEVLHLEPVTPIGWWARNRPVFLIP